jgi:hypothetical protein
MKLTCNSCNKTKPYIEFSKCRARKTGYQGKCKACNKKDNDKFRSENKEYWSYEYGYFSDKKKWKYISEYMAADKPIKVYKIKLPNNKVYIGSTKALMNVRMARHVQDYRRYTQGDKSRSIPLLYKSIDEFFTTYDDLRDYLKSNTYVIEETMGGRKRQMTREQFWIDRYRQQGKELCNSYNPKSKNKYKIKYRNQK